MFNGQCQSSLAFGRSVAEHVSTGGKIFTFSEKNMFPTTRAENSCSFIKRLYFTFLHSIPSVLSSISKTTTLSLNLYSHPRTQLGRLLDVNNFLFHCPRGRKSHSLHSVQTSSLHTSMGPLSPTSAVFLLVHMTEKHMTSALTHTAAYSSTRRVHKHIPPVDGSYS